LATCILRIGDRVVLSSAGGPPEVEYILFDPGEIELASMGPGMVVEVGYRTRAADALARLKEVGITPALVLEAATTVLPAIAITYARGRAVRRIAPALGAAELFEGARYNIGDKVYEGRWLDLPALAADTELTRLTQTLQAMHLCVLLQEVSPEAEVVVITREHMADRRPGARSHRRCALPPPDSLVDTLRTYAGAVRGSPGRGDDSGPTSVDLVELLRDRIALSEDRDTQDRLRGIEKAIGIRERPMRGPLTDPELSAFDEQLSNGQPAGAVEQAVLLEKSKGKQPATAYLKARAALIAGREPARALAERISSLALSMPSFVELELLAVEAWNAAGEPKRALPFARDLISNATVNDELRARDSQRLARQVAPTLTSEGMRPPSSPPTRAPSSPQIANAPTLSMPPEHAPVREDGQATLVVGPPVPTPTPSARVGPSQGDRRPTPSPEDKPSSPGLRPRPFPSLSPRTPLPQPASARRNTPPMMFAAVESSRQDAPAGPVPTTRSGSSGSPKKPISGTWIGPAPQAAPAPPPSTRPPAAIVAPSEGSSPAESLGPMRQKVPTLERTTARPPADAPRLANWSAAELMRGASQPPFRSDSPDAHAHVPRVPSVPHFAAVTESAASLALPEGLDGEPEPVETLPRTVLDARVQFTFRARELAREYEDKLGIVLSADISGIEAIQRVLLERYASRAVSTAEAAADVSRHGAFLSEVLARSFGAFWVDIGPSDVGYWAMVVPPATRVWPFGRILRLIAMQHNERDLVSYFLELQARAASQK
jgi:hypothetical protein